MGKTIWKYPLRVADEVEVDLPAGAVVLDVQPQGDDPRVVQMWALVDPLETDETRAFRIYGTGHPIPETEGGELFHVATFQTLAGAFVGHVFEVVPRRRSIKLAASAAFDGTEFDELGQQIH